MSSEHQLPQHTTGLGVGFGIGILWLLMAATSLWSAWRGWANQRSDWALAWGLVGLLLAAAGLVAMIGTWRFLTHSGPEHS